MDMRKTRVLAVVAAGLLMMALGAVSVSAEEKAAAKATEAPLASSVAAVVNGQEISVDMLNKIMSQVPPSAAKATGDEKKQLLEKLVEMELMVQEAKKVGIEKDPDYVFSMEMLKKQQLYTGLIKKAIMDKVSVTPEEVQKYYDDNKDKYKAEEQVKASHILVDTEEEAKKAKERVDKGEDFAEVAKAISKCPSAPRGGDLGFFGRGRMVPEFEAAAFGLKEGEVSPPVKTQFGWHIIKATGHKEAKVKEFDEVKAEIEQQLTQEKQKKAYDDMLAKLKAEAQIRINDAAVAPPKAAEPAAGEPAKKDEAAPAATEQK